MATDSAPGWGVARSLTAAAVDVLDGVALLLAHLLAFAVSVPLRVGLTVVFEALAPSLRGLADLPAWVTPSLLAHLAWLGLLVPGLAVAAARLLAAAPDTMLAERPGVLLPAPLVLFAGAAAGLLWTGHSAWVAPLLVAEYVLVRRTVHWYAGHVRTGGLSRRGRIALATAALVPLSLVTVFLEGALAASFAPVGDTGAAWLLGQAVAAGLPAQVRLGAALFQTHVLLLLVASPLVCGAYLVVQWIRGLSARSADARIGRSRASFERRATGAVAVPDSGSVVGPLLAGLGPLADRAGSRPPGTAGGASAGDEPSADADAAGDDGASDDPLSDPLTDRKYEDPEAERAHRAAQQRDPAEVVDLGERITLVLDEVDYDRDPPKILGTKNKLVVFVEDAPDDLRRLDTVCVKVTDYGGKDTSAEAVFLDRGPCS